MRKQKIHIYISNIFSNKNVFENGYNYIYIYIYIYIHIYIYIYIYIYGRGSNVNLFKDEFEKAWRFCAS